LVIGNAQSKYTSPFTLDTWSLKVPWGKGSVFGPHIVCIYFVRVISSIETWVLLKISKMTLAIAGCLSLFSLY